MMKTPLVLLMPAALLYSYPQSAVAQGITITPALGAFVPATDLSELDDQFAERWRDRSATLGLGLNVEVGWLRGSLAYATGATLTDAGVTGDAGDGSVLALAADVVVRPLPRLLVQPYLLGGAGVKRLDYSFDDPVFENAFPDEKTDFALHFGVGADIWIGGIGVMAEVTDFVSPRGDDRFGQHDAFFMAGLRFRLGG